MMGVTNIPMLNADIVTGISLMLLFVAFRFTLGFSTVLLAHITFNIPYVILSVMPKLKQTKKSTYEAALDLGASPIYAFFKVVLPDICLLYTSLQPPAIKQLLFFLILRLVFQSARLQLSASEYGSSYCFQTLRSHRHL